MSGKISVIVPVYNVEGYIEKCLDSIINQTYDNYEIVIVNDGSTDRSDEIINRKYAFKKNIKYIRQANKGLGGARNTGIQNSEGEFLFFVDSDDWIRSDAIENIVKALAEDDSDICVFNMEYVFSNGNIKTNVPKIDKRECINAEEAIREELLGQKYKFHAPNKVFKRDLFIEYNDFFPEGKLYEDLATTYKMICHAKKVSLLPETLYYYLQKRKGSITDNTINEKQFSDLFEAVDGVVSYIQLLQWQLDDEIQTFYVENVIGIVNYIIRVDKGKRIKYYTKLKNNRNWKLTHSITKNRYISLIKKMRISMIRYNGMGYCRLLRMIKRIKT